MKIKQTVIASAIFALGLASSVANAITIDGITLAAGSNFETVNVWDGEDLTKAGDGDGFINAVGETLIGIGYVTRIFDISNNVIWQSGDNGKELTLVLRDYVAAQISAPQTIFGQTFQQLDFTGGLIDLYSQAIGTFSATGTQAAGIASASAGTPWLHLVGSPTGGMVGTEAITFTNTSAVGTGGNPLTGATNVSGKLLLDVSEVDGGPAGPTLNSNAFGCIAADGVPCPDTADFKLSSSGQINPIINGANSWALRGTAEVQSLATEIPTPSSILLLGLGLVGLGFTRGNATPKS